MTNAVAAVVISAGLLAAAGLPPFQTRGAQPPVLSPETRTSPSCLIVDLDDNGLSLSSPADGVLFDADADGTPEQVGWPNAEGRDAFLVLDVNGNGSIDSGAELLGNAMRHPLITKKSSGISVVVLLQGGTISEDGTKLTPPPTGKSPQMEPDDEMFAKLRLWLDANRDGKSTPAELRPLADAGISGVGAGAQIINRDQAGHLLRYDSYVVLDLRDRKVHRMYEVVLARK